MSYRYDPEEVMDAFYKFGIEQWEWWDLFLHDHDFHDMSDEQAVEELERVGVSDWEHYDEAIASLRSQ